MNCESCKKLAQERDFMVLQISVLKRIADAASRVVRGCTRKIVANPGGMCTCDDCTHLSVCLGAYFRPEPEVEKAWFEKRVDAPKGKAWDWLGSMPDLPEPPKEA